MSIRRRQFLVQSACSAVAPLLARASAFAAGPTKVGPPDALAMAQLIWSPGARRVPTPGGGGAEGSSSSTHGTPEEAVADIHCVFAKEITLSAVPSLASLHVFAFTRYRLYVNGVYLGRGPSRYQNQRPEYDSRDVRHALQPGQNLVVVLVHRDAPTGRIMRHDPGFMAALEVMVGGRRRVIATDPSWLAMPELSFGARAQAWSSIEEHIDARKTPDWTRPDLKDPIWNSSVVVPDGGDVHLFPRSTPLQREQERPWSSEPSTLPLDLAAGNEVEFGLGEIVQAFHVLEIDAEEGSSFELTYVLPEGQVSGRCTYIARAGVQTYMGGDTFAFVRLRIRLAEGRARLTRAAAVEVRYPFERAASFLCSDPFLSRLWAICARSLEVMSEDSYVDCADRERVEWTDDSPPAFDCTRVMMRGPDSGNAAVPTSHWGDARLVRALLRRIALTQQPGGQLKAHSCSERFDVHAVMEDRSCGWVVLLREYLESSGDADLVRELWPTLATLLDWYRERRTARGLVLAREWEVWDNPLRYQICEGAGLNAMVHRALDDASILARAIGKHGPARALAAEAERLRSHFNELLWNESAGAYDGALFGPGSEMRSQSGGAFSGPVVDGRFRPTAQANLFALYAGVVPVGRLDSVRSWVLDHLDEIRGPMAHYYLFRMLYAMEDERADSLVLERMRKGWTPQVESQWQTSWEELQEGGGSKIHIYGISPGYFLTAYVLGARREGPVDRRTLVIEPRFSRLEWAKGVCVTEWGPVEIEWNMDADHRPVLACTIPGHVKGKLRLRPRGAKDVLEVDGVAASTRVTRGTLETVLPPGKHEVRFRS